MARQSRNKLKPIHLIEMENAWQSEPYRTLRTNLQFATDIKDAKIILVTSSLADEGKSTVLGNLAITFGQSGKRVLVVDADLRKPCQHYAFRISNLTGLSNAIIDARSGNIDGAAYISETAYPGISVLPCGTIPPNPSELLSSPQCATLIQHLRDQFDYVLIDSPPILSLSDALVLTRVADGVLLVVNSKKTGRHVVRKSLSALKQVDASVLGTVLNRFPKKLERYQYV